jgi:hypothetical protein
VPTIPDIAKWQRIAIAVMIGATSPPTPAAESALLPSGTPILLELQHHITSAYTAPGSAIRFRVAEDLVIGGRTLVVAGTPVTGRMRQTGDRAMLGASGSMTFAVDFVPAADGQQLRVIANETHQGRDRGNALAGWTLFWGLPGLMTRGVHSYLARGTRFQALVLHDRRIGDALPVSPPAAVLADATASGRVLRHRFSETRADPLRLDFERDRALGTVQFFVEAPAGTDLAGFRLVAVDGAALDEPVAALSATPDSFSFDSWSLLRYCRHGSTTLGWLGSGADGQPVGFEYKLAVEIKHGK